MRTRFRLTTIFLLFCAFALVATPAMAKRSKSYSKASAKTEQVASSSKKTKKSKKRAVAAPVLGEGKDPLRLRVRSAIAADYESGSIFYEKDPDKQIAPASLTKVLTLYIVREAIEQGKLREDDVVKVSRRAACASGSVMDLYTGERVTVRELMKGIAVASANDGCVAIAEHMSGSVDNFVRLMNRKARSLGMLRTVFKTPNGLPADGQVTTARDMLKLSRAYLKRFPDSLTLHSTRNYVHNRRNHQNANRLLGSFEGADGLKTGFVNASGYNIIATAKRDGKRIIAVTLGSNTSGVRKRETARLMEKVFADLGKPATGLAKAKTPRPEPWEQAEEDVTTQVGERPEAQGGGLVGRQGSALKPVSLQVPAKGRYTIQDSTFRSMENARGRQAALRDDGIPARVVATKGDKSTFYRVLIGRYTSIQQAEATRRKLASDYNLPNTLITR
ncbi:SPOR domain-containing protein [Desulfovibrio aminophilus]|uniref:SPOR domain-containing protein n=1 Tax=Desulfovibrio aminophilus TaxID=81425 RepID=UPI0033925F7D